MTQSGDKAVLGSDNSDVFFSFLEAVARYLNQVFHFASFGCFRAPQFSSLPSAERNGWSTTLYWDYIHTYAQKRDENCPPRPPSPSYKHRPGRFCTALSLAQAPEMSTALLVSFLAAALHAQKASRCCRVSRLLTARAARLNTAAKI